MNLDWGDVPGWVEAISTGLAIGGVAATLYMQIKDRRGLQASNIDFYMDGVGTKGFMAPIAGLVLDFPRLKFVIMNVSNNPINEVLISVPFASPNVYDLSKVPPGEFPIDYLQLDSRKHDPMAARLLIPLIQFRDQSGRYWQRLSDGTLRKLTGRYKKYRIYAAPKA